MARGKKRRVNDSVDGAAVAQVLLSKRTNTSTKRTYQSKVKTIIAWLAEHHPSAIDVERKTLQLSLDKSIVLDFFGYICSPANTCDQDGIHANDAPSVPLSVSCVWGYRSALVDVYHSRLLDLESSLDTELRRMLEGYEKVINRLKRRGLMKIKEGKRDIKSSGYGILALKLMKDAPTRKGQSWSTVMFGWGYFVHCCSIERITLQDVLLEKVDAFLATPNAFEALDEPRDVPFVVLLTREIMETNRLNSAELAFLLT